MLPASDDDGIQVSAVYWIRPLRSRAATRTVGVAGVSIESGLSSPSSDDRSLSDVSDTLGGGVLVDTRRPTASDADDGSGDDVLSAAAVMMSASAAIRTLLLRRGFSLSPLLLLLLPSLLPVLTSDDGPLALALALLRRGEFDVSDVVYS